MVELNATFIIQTFNFLIAYCLLRVLFFKPAINIIMRKRTHQLLLAGDIQTKTDAIAAKEQEIQRSWKEFQQSAIAMISTKAFKYNTAILASEQALLTLPEEQKKVLVAEVTSLLVQELDHVR